MLIFCEHSFWKTIAHLWIQMGEFPIDQHGLHLPVAIFPLLAPNIALLLRCQSRFQDLRHCRQHATNWSREISPKSMEAKPKKQQFSISLQLSPRKHSTPLRVLFFLGYCNLSELFLFEKKCFTPNPPPSALTKSSENWHSWWANDHRVADQTS